MMRKGETTMANKKSANSIRNTVCTGAKRTVGYLLAALMMLSAAPTNIYAAGDGAIVIHEDEASMNDRRMQRLNDFFQNHKNDSDEVSFYIYDKQGEEITEEFYSNAQQYFLTKNDKELLNYYINSVGSSVKATDTVKSVRSDLAKVHVEDVVRELSDIVDGHPGAVTVDYTVTGTIYYDPNTFKISSTTGPYRSAITYSYQPSLSEVQFGSSYVTMNSSIAADKYSAQFTHSNKIMGENTGLSGPYDFGYVKTTFTIAP